MSLGEQVVTVLGRPETNQLSTYCLSRGCKGSLPSLPTLAIALSFCERVLRYTTQYHHSENTMEVLTTVERIQIQTHFETIVLDPFPSSESGNHLKKVVENIVCPMS